MTASDNQMLSEREAHAERTIDETLAVGEEDIGNGPLEARSLLVELAARCVARAVLAFEVHPQEASDLVCALEVERS